MAAVGWMRRNRGRCGQSLLGWYKAEAASEAGGLFGHLTFGVAHPELALDRRGQGV